MLHEATPDTLANARDEAVQRWRARYRPSTAATYRQALDSFLAHLRSRYNLATERSLIASIPPDSILTYYADVLVVKSPETEHLYLRALVSFLQHEARGRGLHPTVIAAAQATLDSRRKRSKAINTEPHTAVAALIAYTTTLTPPPAQSPSERRSALRVLRDRAVILTACSTGIPEQDLCDLRVADVRDKALSVSATSYRPSVTALSAIRSYLALRGDVEPTSPLFARHDKRAGTAILPISRWTVANIVTARSHETALLGSAAAEHEILVSLNYQHLLTYFAACAVASAPDIATAQRVAHHRDRGTTRRYRKMLETKAPEQSENETPAG